MIAMPITRQYQVRALVRQAGADGKFCEALLTIEADSLADARELAPRAIWGEGLELLGIEAIALANEDEAVS